MLSIVEMSGNASILPLSGLVMLIPFKVDEFSVMELPRTPSRNCRSECMPETSNQPLQVGSHAGYVRAPGGMQFGHHMAHGMPEDVFISRIEQPLFGAFDIHLQGIDPLQTILIHQLFQGQRRNAAIRRIGSCLVHAVIEGMPPDAHAPIRIPY